MSSCQSSPFYEKNYDLAEGQWFVDSVRVFDFNIQDHQTPYFFYYNIRNTIDYPYYNLYVTFYLEDSTGEIISEQLQNISLMDEKTGKPFGSGWDVFSHQLMVPLLNPFTFPAPGKYKLRLQQYMRRDPLPGILTVGLRIEKGKS